jgi:hypothetical protein
MLFICPAAAESGFVWLFINSVTREGIPNNESLSKILKALLFKERRVNK